MDEELEKERERAEQEAREQEERARREREEQEAERERAEKEAREKEEREEKLREDYLADKHCAYCTHLIPDKRDGRAFYCDKLYDYVSGPQRACRNYEEAGRSTLISDQIYSDQYGYEAEEHDCAFCSHLDPNKKSEGRYYCDATKRYVKGTDSNKTMQCSSFKETSRSDLQCELIRDDSESLDSHNESNITKRFCSDCKYFDIDDKKGEGLYTCTKRNQTMYADQEECYMFEASSRGSRENEKYFDEAKEGKKDAELKNVGNPALGFLVLIILSIILAVVSIFTVLKK